MIHLQHGLCNGVMVSVEDVERGLDCGCTCPDCGGRFIAKQGAERVWHFAHSDAKEGRGCHETLLHKRAKELLKSRKVLMLPPVYRVPYSKCLYPFSSVVFDEVEVEVQVGNGRADAVGWIGDMCLAVEFYVTHKVTAERIYEYRDLQVAAVEIDLVPERCLDDSIIASFLEGAAADRRWICNKHIDSIRVGSGGYVLHSCKIRNTYYSY